MATPVGQLTIEMAANIVRLQKDMEGARKTVDGAMQSITKTVQSAMNTVGALFAGVSIGAFAGKLVAVEREFGTLNASLVTVTGSAREADKAFAMLTNFASTTPYSLQEVTQAFIKLKALGMDPSVAALTSYGNTASAMGKSLNQMIEAVADAATGEFERLKEFGIKAKSEGDRVTLTFRGVSTNIGKNAAEIEGYLRRIGDVDFAGAMDARAKTLDGAISNLGDSWDSLFRTINNELTGPLLMTAVQGAQTAVVGLGNVVQNLTEFMEQNKVALMAFAAILAGPAIVSGIGAAVAAFVALRTAVIGLTLAFAANPIALAILAITAAAVPAIDGIQKYMNANKALEKEQANLNQSQAETERLLRQAEPVRAKAIVSTKALTDADKERAKELKKQEDAYTKLINDIEDKTGVMLLERQQTEKLTESQKVALKIMQDIQSGTLKLNQAQKIKITQSLEELLSTERINIEMKELAKTQAAAIALSDKLNEEQNKQTETLRNSVVALIEQNDELRLGKEAVLARQIAVMRSNATDLEFAAATYEGNEALAEQARLLRQQADLAEDNMLLRAAKETADEFSKTSTVIEDSLTNALMRGFESGKGFGQNFKDTLVNMFKTMVINPIIQPIAKGAASSLMSSLGLTSSAKGLMIGGATLAAQGSALAQGFMTSVSGMVSGGAPVVSMGSATSAAFNAGGSAASTAAMAMPYVAAALVALNALGAFRSNRIVGGGLTGTLGQGDISSYDLNRRGGTLFSGPDYSIVNMQTSEMSKHLQTAFKGMRDSAVAMGQVLGKSTESIETFTMAIGDVRVHPDIAQLGLVLDGLTDEEKTAKIEAVLELANERMAEMVLNGGGMFERLGGAAENFARAGETAYQTLVRLADIQSVSLSLNEFGGAFSNFAKSSVVARQSIIDLAGGIEALVQKTQGFVSNFYTSEEQAAITAKGVVVGLTNAGFTASQIAALETRADLRTLLESIDVNTTEGQKQFVAILDLQQQFANIQPMLEQQNANLYALIEAAPQVEILQRILESDAAYQERVQQTEEIANDLYRQMVDGIMSVNTSIKNMTTLLGNQLDGVVSEKMDENAVIAAYGSIGRSESSIDQEGFNFWMNKLESGELTRDQLFEAMAPALGGFAMGGYMNGPALVGEHGPEIFDPRTSQIYTAPATSNIFGGNEVAAEIRALRDEVNMMRYEARSTAVNTAKIARLQDNWDVRGLTVRTDVDQPLDTVTI